MDQDIKEIVLAFGGVVIGFALGEIAIRIRSYREITIEGELFDFEIDSLKPALEKQIQDLKVFATEIEGYKETAASITVFKSLEYFKELDRKKIAEYYKRKDKANAKGVLRERLEAVRIIDFEIERLLQYYTEYSENLGKNMKRYKIVFDKFTRRIGEIVLQTEARSYSDPYTNQIKDLVIPFMKNPVSNVVAFQKSLHEPLIKLDVDNIKDVLHPVISEFNQNGSDIINEIQSETKEFLTTLNTLNESLIDRFKTVYKTEPQLNPIS